jgi:hypothetical protein
MFFRVGKCTLKLSIQFSPSGIMLPGGGGREMELSCDGVSSPQLSNCYRSLGILTASLCSVFKSGICFR